MENQQTIECLIELISILSHNLNKGFYQFKFKGDNLITFKSFESLDSPSLFKDLKNAISLWNSLSSDSELKVNFHLNPKDREITLTW